MRGHGESNGSLWYSLDLEELVERDHPLRAIKRMVDDALRGMDADFRRAYSRNGRPSVAPERLLKALLLQALYTIRSERECALGLVRSVRKRHKVAVTTLAADMGYDSGDFLAALERESVRPHVAVRAGRIIAEDEGGDARRRARVRQRNAGYWRSQRRRKIVEEFFGWSKTVGGLRRSRHPEMRSAGGRSRSRWS